MRPLWMLKDADVALQTGNGSETVLRRLNLRIDEGECVAVVGRNGSGKSTLLRALAGLAEVAGGETEQACGPHKPARIVFQNPDAQIVGETVYEDISFGLENMAVAPEAMPSRVRSALDAVGLDVPPDRPVEHLSGGQKQLLCIAGAIATGARALLLDEPTSMLDPEAKADVLRVIRRLREDGATVVWTTQALDELG
ncbi:ABC transporter ATP-binding protein, partial [Paenibacillus sp. GYB003]|uniref:ABC transporter ATP-binding protein n=1 Tax=Paenibacillus sp. GYB003 TaxID=2994392 RepID=UPI002F96D7DE